MFKEERLNFILNEVNIRNRVLLSDISNKLNVSEDTVRRDLKFLDDQGKLKKVHGGAISNTFHVYSYQEKDIYAHTDKTIIAQKAVSLIKADQVILMSGGTTNLELARIIPDKIHLTVFTPSLPVAMQLLDHELIETIFIGGKLSHEAQIALGGETLHTLAQIKADLCFLGTGYVDATAGLTEFDWEVVQLKKAMIRSSTKVVALTISEKLHSAQRFKICNTDEIHTLITELSPENPILESFKKLEVELI